MLKCDYREYLLIRLAALVLCAGVVTFSVLELHRSYNMRIQVVYTEADLSGYLVSEWIKKSLSDIRAILKDCLYGLNRSNILSAGVTAQQRADRNRRLFHKADQYRNIIFLGIFDPKCVIQYGSIGSIIGGSSRDLNRDYCNKVVQPPLRRLKFSDLFLSSTGDLNISATYPLLGKNNRVTGFALAGLNLSFFQRWLDSIKGEVISISIIDFNRILLARKPESKNIGKPIKDAQLKRFIESDARSTTFRLKSPVDGIERFWSMRKTGNFPFVVAVGYQLADVLGPWWNKLVIYAAGNLLLIVMTVLFVLAYRKNSLNAKSMEKLAMHDPLTALMNRRSFNAVAQLLFREAQSFERADSVVMVDIDHFKKINDNFGHDQGDLILKQAATVIRSAFRSSDLVCRWGGEEFLIYLAATDEGDAVKLAEKLRQKFATALCRTDRTVTISLGVASIRSGESYEQLLKRVDRLLYCAKTGGRNRVCTEDSSSPVTGNG